MSTRKHLRRPLFRLCRPALFREVHHFGLTGSHVSRVTDKPVIIDSDGNNSCGKVIRLAETRVLAIGATVVVPPDEQFEAWEVHDDRGWRLVCLPGTAGEMAEWTSLQNGR